MKAPAAGTGLGKLRKEAVSLSKRTSTAQLREILQKQII